MKIHAAWVLALTVAATASLVGCEADDSAPKHPRRAGILAPDEKARENAERRELEKPGRDLPTTGREFPGQGRAPQTTPQAGPQGGAQVALLDADRQRPRGSSTTFFGARPGPLPHLDQMPQDRPATGYTTVEGVAIPIDHSWGQVLPMANYPHRAWPDGSTQYLESNIKHNPVYWEPLTTRWGAFSEGYLGNVAADFVEVPWFVVQTAISPIKWFIDPPLAQKTTRVPVGDPLYHGYLPADGPVVPAPYPGQIRWRYPWEDKSSTQPATIRGPGADTQPAATHPLLMPQPKP